MTWRWIVLLVVVFLSCGAAALGHDVEQRLSPAAGFQDPNAESSRAEAILDQEFGAGPANLVLVVTGDDGSAPSVEDGVRLEDRVRAFSGVTEAASFWSTGDPSLQSIDSRSALVVAQLLGDEDEINASFEEIHSSFLESPVDGVSIGFAGQAAVMNETLAQSESDLRRAELLAIPLVLAVLLYVFRSPVAALLPVAIGVVSIVMTMAILRMATQLGSVSIFALNLTTALGFGLAVDYCLLFITRYRAEVAKGSDALARTRRTAGRSIAFSAVTTAAALCCLAIFPLGFLRSMALAGTAVVLVAAILALVVLPICLELLGPNLERWTLPGRSQRHAGMRWERVATRASTHPKLVALAGLVFLGVLALPFLDANWGLADDRILSPASETRTAHDTIRSEYSGAEFGGVSVVFDEARDGEDEVLAIQLSSLPGAGRVASAAGVFEFGERLRVALPDEHDRFTNGDSSWLAVIPSVDPTSAEGLALVDSVRAHVGDTALVGGVGARQIDTTKALTDRIPLVVGAVMAITFVLLASLARSVLVPVKALALNVLSLAATLGAIVWVFQIGHFSGLLNFTPTGSVDLSVVMLVVLVAFGLSMDYEVFLVSRMREEYDRTGDNVRAIVESVKQTAAVISASAALIAIVFAAFLVADVTLVKMTGLGIALAVIVDALVVRATLTPALMVLAGDANWWLPSIRRKK